MENTNKTTKQKCSFPFAIVIRTLDETYVERGGPRELVFPCDGYFLCTTRDDSTTCSAQGAFDAQAIYTSLSKALDDPRAMLALVADSLFEN